MVASLQKSHFHDLEILSRSRYSNRAVESLLMNNDNKPPARTEKRKPQDGKLQSYLEWPKKKALQTIDQTAGSGSTKQCSTPTKDCQATG